jgi:hypothetical protein
MKSVKTILSVFFLSLTISAATSQDLRWGKMLGSDKEEYALNHVTDKDGNIYVAGKTNGVVSEKNLGQNDGFVIKLDSEGNKLWSAQFGSEGDEDIQWSAIDNKGSVYIAGTTTMSQAGKAGTREDIIIVKYNPDGRKEWQRQIGTDSTDIAKGIFADSKGSVFVTGLTNGKMGQSVSGKADCFLMKLDQKGNILKTIQFGTPLDDHGYSVTGGTDDDIFICGTTWGDLGGKNAGFIDGFTGHFSSDLVLKEFRQFGTDGFDIPLVLHTDKNNDLFIGGSTSGNFGGTQIGEGDCFLLRMDGKGTIVWNRQFGTDHHDGIRGIDINDSVSENILVSGIQNLPPEKAFVRLYSKDGNMLWEKIIVAPGRTDGTSGKDVLFDLKGNFTHLGLTGFDMYGPIIGGHDAFIMKMSLPK